MQIYHSETLKLTVRAPAGWLFAESPQFPLIIQVPSDPTLAYRATVNFQRSVLDPPTYAHLAATIDDTYKTRQTQRRFETDLDGQTTFVLQYTWQPDFLEESLTQVDAIVHHGHHITIVRCFTLSSMQDRYLGIFDSLLAQLSFDDDIDAP